MVMWVNLIKAGFLSGHSIEKRAHMIRFQHNILLISGLALLTPLGISNANAQSTRPPLIVTNAPLPADLKNRIYRKPVQVREIKPSDIIGDSYSVPTSTPVSERVGELSSSLYTLQSDVSGLSSSLNNIQRDNERKAAEYYAAIATINTQLQSGTTPGNPRLVRRMRRAEQNLGSLADSLVSMNRLAADTAQKASEASFLLESARATYGLSGGVEEDHVQLAELEDAVNNTVVIIDRILNTVNDDISRANTYLSSERNNIRALSLAVSNGDLYGVSLANRPFSNVPVFTPASTGGSPAAAPVAPVSAAPLSLNPSPPSQPRPLVKIRFDRPDVNYEEPLYAAVNKALDRYPNAQFELVAVHPTQGNAAEVAIESTRARRNAEQVLRTLTQLGLTGDRVERSYNKSDTAASSEVHLYIR